MITYRSTKLVINCTHISPYEKEITFWPFTSLTYLLLTAVEVGVPKLGNCLEMYTCAQACVQFVHSMCTNLDTPCTLELLPKLATPCTLELYTCLGTDLGTCVHFQAVSKLGHSNFYSSSSAFHCSHFKRRAK